MLEAGKRTRRQPAPMLMATKHKANNSEPDSKKKLGSGPTRQIDSNGTTAIRNSPKARPKTEEGGLCFMKTFLCAGF